MTKRGKQLFRLNQQMIKTRMMCAQLYSIEDSAAADAASNVYDAIQAALVVFGIEMREEDQRDPDLQKQLQRISNAMAQASTHRE